MPERKKTTKAAAGAAAPKRRKAAAKNEPSAATAGGADLVIVESPAKQRTISRFLQNGYVVASSYGHVRDLPEKKLGVDEDNDFEPSYVLLPRTKKLLPELRKMSDRAGHVYLATDHDREGESIAWHLVQILNLPEEKVRRITFHEITPEAIREAMSAPRGVDMNLVQAQQARRVIDRLVGYKLSPLLWRKIRRGLSAGRVQSVAVRLVVEREKEIQAFASEAYWALHADLRKPGQEPGFSARLTQWKGEKVESTKVYKLFAEDYQVRSTCFPDREAIDAVSSRLSGQPFEVTQVERREQRRKPLPPFITSTMQQAGSQKLGFAAERTMHIAQSLYEGVDVGEEEPAGLITYMRTDSVTVAKVAQESARTFIGSEYGPTYMPETPPVYATKAVRAQEAHEAIRPTSIHRTPDKIKKYLSPEQLKLYTLVWRRFLASQMKEAVYDTLSVDIRSGEGLFRASGRTLKFDGFLKVWQERQEEETPEEAEEGRLPDLSAGDKLELSQLRPQEHKTSPPPYYNEASLIRALERNGIGRPSTYAPTIQTIAQRGYVRRGIKDRRLTPTDLGTLVVERLKQHFADQVSLGYTAQVEEQLDSVAEGSGRWQDVVNSFYDPFSKLLAAAQEGMEDSRIQPQETDEECPLCQSKMLIRESRFGKYLSCSRFPRCKGKVQLDAEGKKVLPEMTDEKCDLCAKPMVIRTGRKGRFLACSGYPACKNTYSLDAEGKKIEGSRPIITSRPCNKCGKPMWMRLGKRGHFLACSGFPRCRNLKPLSKDDAEKFKAEALAKGPTPPKGGSSPAPEGTAAQRQSPPVPAASPAPDEAASGTQGSSGQ